MEGKSQTIYKVPVFKNNDMFMVWATNGSVRYFNAGNLPDVVKIPLGIIMNSPAAQQVSKNDDLDFESLKKMIMDNSFAAAGFGEEYKGIGCQINKFLYVVILNEDEMGVVAAAPTAQ